MLGARASDWEEDRPLRVKPAESQQDTVILEESPARPESTHGHGDAESTPSANGGPSKQSTGSDSDRVLLQGSATAIRTKPALQSSSAMAAQSAAHLMEVARIDQDADRFLQQAEVNVVTPPAVFRAFLEKSHPEFSLSSTANSTEKLLVVRGQWDDSTKPLHSLGLKFRPIKTKELMDFPLDKCKVIIIDCAGYVPKQTLQKIRDFVIQGGYLVSTDWTLQNVIERSFPNFITWNRDNTDGSITDAFVIEPENHLMTGIQGRRFTWKLDRMSQCVRIVNPSKVKILARSSKLAQRDPQLRVLGSPLLAGALATEFSIGNGKVLHLVGHFDNCSTSFKPNMLPDPAAGIGISLRQAITSNFIVEGLQKGRDAQLEPAAAK